jgi:hypothetical protein
VLIAQAGLLQYRAYRESHPGEAEQIGVTE